MTDCIFCKIIAGDIPSNVVYEDDIVKVIMDIHPVAPGHLLLLTKEHFDDTAVTDDEILAHLIKMVKTVSSAVMRATGATGFNLIVNNGTAAGQVVHHTHWHIIPRRDGDGLAHWPGQQDVDLVEIEQTANAIKAALGK